MRTKRGAAAREDRERFWRELIAGHARSGGSVRAWCEKRGVAEPSFYAWRRKLAGRKAEAGGGPWLVPVEVAQGAGPVELEIELPGRVFVRAGRGCDADLLRQALLLLRGPPEAEAC